MGNDIGVTGGGSFAARQYKSSAQRNGNAGDFGKFLQSEEEKGTRGKEVERPEGERTTQSGKQQAEPGDALDYRKQLQEHMEQMLENIKHGTIQPKFRIGAQEFTHEEWKDFIEKIDAAEEDLREQLEAELEAVKEEAEKKAARREAEKEEKIG